MPIVAAIDTGGTKIVGAAVDEKGNILKEIRIPNTERNGSFIMDTYRKLIWELDSEYEISAVGIGAGGRIDEESGTVLYAVDIYKDYIGLQIGKILENEFAVPVEVTNDCRAAVIGEHWMGAARGVKDVFGIILGTGVGGGYYTEGHMIRGYRGGNAEIGHMILHPGGKKCLCGQRGCVEQYVSGTALWNLYRDKKPEATITSGYEFFNLYAAGDETAQKVLEEFVNDLAYCIVNAANLFDPEICLIGGGLADTSEYWWDKLKKTYSLYGNSHTKNIPLVKAAQGNRAAILGAAKLAFDVLK